MQPEHFDVLVVGAGISGIGAGCHLQAACPDQSYQILESRERMGGTWDMFRYPGIRSDSDMYTLGYSFRPWTSPKAIADGPAILEYLQETAREHGIDRKIRFGHHVRRASWSSRDALWTVEAERSDTKQLVRVHVSLPLHVQRLLRLRRGSHAAISRHANASAGASCILRNGPMTSTTHEKRVVVIGSGATAMTLVPELAKKSRARHDAPAFADLRRRAACRRCARELAAAPRLTGGRVRDRPLEERADQHGVFPVLPTGHRSEPRRCSCAA